MNEVITFALTGLGQGAVFAALAMSLVITFKGTGVINFAAGAIGAWSAFTYSELRTTGRLVLPYGSVDLGDTVGTIPGVIVASSVGVVVGLLSHLLVFRPLRHAPPLARIVASVGLMLAVQSLAIVRFGAQTRSVPPILPSDTVQVGGGVPIPQDRLWLSAAAVVLCIASTAWFRFSHLGIAIRAAAENERFASLFGSAPDRLAAIAWAISTGVLSFACVLAAPVTGVSAPMFTFFIVPALACALVGGLRSIGVAVVAGLALGVINAEVTYLATKSWWPVWATKGVSSAVPLVVIVVVLLARGQSLPTRGSDLGGTIPTVVRPRVRPGAIVALVATGIVGLLFTAGSYRFGLIITMAVSLVGLSFVVLTGYLGQVSLAQASFAGLAGFGLARLADDWGLPFPIAPILAAVAAAALGVVVGLPALRVRGVQLAVLTLSLGFAFEQLILYNPAVNDRSGNRIPEPVFFGLDLGVREATNTARWQFGVLVLTTLLAGCLVVANLARSATGRRFLAVRSNERASASVGIDVTRSKLFGFGLSAFLAGVAGTLIGYGQGSVSAASYTTMVGLTWLVFAYLGGISSIGGALVAGMFAPLGLAYVLVDRWIGPSRETYDLVAAVSLVVMAVLSPEGITGAARRSLARARIRSGRGAPPGTATRAGETGRHHEPLPGAGGRPRTRSSASHVSGAPVLVTSNLSVAYGGVHAVRDVSLRVDAGSIVGLIGANGAGKTSFVDAVSGFTPATGGIELCGESISDLPAFLRARSGMSRTWQSLELFDDLDVRENLAVAATHDRLVDAGLDLVRPNRPGRSVNVDRLLEMFDLVDVAHESPTSLPLGRQKHVNVARAVAADPQLLLLDEPAAGLSAAETEALGRLLRSLVANDPSLGVLLIEHDVDMVFDICDCVYVLDAGNLIAQGAPADVRRDPAVIAAYLGPEAHAGDDDIEVPLALDEHHRG